MWAIEKPQVSKTAGPGAPGNGGPTFIRLDGKTPGVESRETLGHPDFLVRSVLN